MYSRNQLEKIPLKNTKGKQHEAMNLYICILLIKTIHSIHYWKDEIKVETLPKKGN